MLKLVTKFSLCLIILLLISCNHESMESEFFDWETFDIDKLYNYSLEDQFKIFIYGNQTMSSFDDRLGDSNCKKRQASVGLCTEIRYRGSNNDLDFRDSLEIFRAMEKGGYYSVCSDSY